MKELLLKQKDVVDRSGVSRAIVREIQHNTIQRDRGERTLSAISEALDWDPAHLDAVRHGQIPPSRDAPAAGSTKDVSGRLTAIEYDLRTIQNRLDEVATEIKAGIEQIIERLSE